ncbi:hypothetical protein F4604DRAFT_1804170 [Suillus subluteus]|nr:hypothetical protein F4604DRAFT_1804170 [Suillus subluteus]
MEILKGVLTYPNSTDYRPDIDDLSPVEVVVSGAIADISPTGPATPIVASSQKQNAHIVLSKKVMPIIIELYMHFKDELKIYEDGTMEAVFLAYSTSTKLKYEYPAPLKFGKDPLWKIATTSFLHIVTDLVKRMAAFGDRISDTQLYRSSMDPSHPDSPSIDTNVSDDSWDLHDFEKVDLDIGSTAPIFVWCFDLLILICSNVTSGNPIHLAHEDELLYILRKVLDLRLSSGILWATLSELPSKYSVSQPAINVTLSPSALIADVAQRSPVAHLFYFYLVLCEITSIPQKTPSSWVITNSSPPEKERGGNFLQPHISALEEGGNVMEVDARTLARKALQVLGKGMGAI